jgi:hypothetical protein
MKITDEIVHIAACEYLGKPHDYNVPVGNINDMRKALEAAIKYAQAEQQKGKKHEHNR